MSSRELLILPFGLLPVIFIIGWVVILLTRDKLQKEVGSKMSSGITEYPSEISLILDGFNNNDLNFSEDGKSIIISLEPFGFYDLSTQEGVKNYLKENISYRENYELKWIDQYEIGRVIFDKDANKYKVSVSLPDEVALTDKDVEDEIKNIGRVYKRNSSNKARYLMYSSSNNYIEKKGDRIFVYIERSQTVPSVLSDTKTVLMSEQQITRNIKNRLWNKVDVKCVSLDDDIYVGEVTGLMRSVQ